MTGHDEFELSRFLGDHGLTETLETIARLHTAAVARSASPETALLQSELTMVRADVALLRSALAGLVTACRETTRKPQVGYRIAEAMAVLDATKLSER
jgi:hypothetical protein